MYWVYFNSVLGVNLVHSNFDVYLMIFRNIIVMFRVYSFKLLGARLDKAVN